MDWNIEEDPNIERNYLNLLDGRASLIYMVSNVENRIPGADQDKFLIL